MANAAHSPGEPCGPPGRWWRADGALVAHATSPGEGDLNSWTRMARPPGSLPGS